MGERLTVFMVVTIITAVHNINIYYKELKKNEVGFS